MRITYLTPTSIYSGGEKITLDTAKAMRSRGHNVVYCGLDGPIRREVENSDMQFCDLGSFTLSRVRCHLHNLNPDLVHCMDFRASTYAAVLRWPFVAHLHSNPPWLRSIGVNTCAMLMFTLRAKAVITVSASVWDEFVLGRLLPQKLMRKRIHVMPNCVNVEQIRKKSLPPLGEKFDLIFIGRFVELKRPELFINCVDTVRERLPGVRAAMLGEGPLRPKVQKKITALALEENITLAGQQENPFPWLAASKVIVIPSAWEGFGLVAVEAMALGRPVVACAVGGLRDIVDFSNGALCAFPEELGHAACELLTDDTRYIAASNGALQRASKYTNSTAYYNDIEDLYTT